VFNQQPLYGLSLAGPLMNLNNSMVSHERLGVEPGSSGFGYLDLKGLAAWQGFMICFIATGYFLLVLTYH